MRFLMKVLLLLMVLLVTPAVFAQSDDGGLVLNMQGISDGCGDTMSADACMDTSWTTTLCTDAACPSCGLDMTLTKSVCYRLTGNTGYCSCQGGGVTTDKYGNKWPSCKSSGSCLSHR